MGAIEITEQRPCLTCHTTQISRRDFACAQCLLGEPMFAELCVQLSLIRLDRGAQNCRWLTHFAELKKLEGVVRIPSVRFDSAGVA